MVPASLRSPVIEAVFSTKMPNELLPSTVIEPVLSIEMVPSSTPSTTSMPLRLVPVAKAPPTMPVLPSTCGV